jgi:outer membrane protein assembly factor BamB
MTLIDLGEAAWDEFTPGPPADHRRIQRALLAVLVAAGVFVLAGSAHGSTPSLRPVWNIPYSERNTTTFDRHTLYVAGLDEQSRSSLTAYDLATGARRWSSPAGDEPTGHRPQVLGDVVIASADPRMVTHEDSNGNRYSFPSARTTIALDAATGARLWRTSGEARVSTGTGTLLISENDEQGRAVRLRQVRPRDGVDIWSRALPPLAAWTLLPDDDNPTAIATATSAGQFTIFGYAAGEPRRHGRMSWATKAITPILWPAGNNLAVIRDITADDNNTTVYDSTTFQPLWTSGWVLTCGRLVCSTDVRGVTGRDPVTGRVVWTSPGAQDTIPVSDDRVLFGAGVEPQKLQLADAKTGRPIGRPLTGLPSGLDSAANAVLVLRSSSQPVGSTVVTRLDLADGRQSVLGWFPSPGGLTPGGPTPCVAAPGYLVCPVGDKLQIMATGPATVG